MVATLLFELTTALSNGYGLTKNRQDKLRGGCKCWKNTVEHRPGSRHQNADSLSRFPHSEEKSEGVLPVMALNTPGKDADTSATAASYGTSREDAGNLQTTDTGGEWLSGWSKKLKLPILALTP